MAAANKYRKYCIQLSISALFCNFIFFFAFSHFGKHIIYDDAIVEDALQSIDSDYPFMIPIYSCDSRETCVFSGNLSTFAQNRYYSKTSNATQIQLQRESIVSRMQWELVDRQLVVPSERLLIGYIAKNSCTRLKQLATVMNQNQSCFDAILRQYQYKHPSDIHLIPDKVSGLGKISGVKWKAMMSDEKWYSVVVIRDPLERFISGFVDKCVNGDNDWNCGWLPKTKPPLNRSKMFISAAEEMYRIYESGGVHLMNEHFRPQFYFFYDLIRMFDFIVVYRHHNFGSAIEWVLKRMGKERWYYNRFGQHCNESLLSTFTRHSTNAAQLEKEFLEFDPISTHKLCQVFCTDYQQLPLQKREYCTDMDCLHPLYLTL